MLRPTARHSRARGNPHPLSTMWRGGRVAGQSRTTPGIIRAALARQGVRPYPSQRGAGRVNALQRLVQAGGAVRGGEAVVADHHVVGVEVDPLREARPHKALE